MDPTLLQQIFNAKMTDDDFNRLSDFIYKQSGIKMPYVKLIMLQSRLQKRLKELKISTYKDYVDYVFSEEGQKNEIIHMLDVVSTNKTDFFREPVHFDFLNTDVLPKFMNNIHLNYNFKVWSAGCSSGEEPYTIAITLQEFKNRNPRFDYFITATDISLQILQHASLAVYKEERISNIPLEIKRKYFLRSKDHEKKTVRVVKELRNKVAYYRLNFMNDTYNLPDVFDVIFCRNVLIYFNRETQEQVINKLCLKLKSGGYLFIGHSESILGMKVPLEQIKPTIFKRI
ncbi:MAG: chemotaxis protein CheR [Bacteroidetes bacterium GWC2_33_15]|nr:MAG: chemotaxis protein CheR [Bacteroidetes bacterium GWA2_33_15]OFX52170.1 MAG: chemotaxis protein CheR [Bacteroidetes bacterium GWC2_33_15]OFX64324.1 MAG: chemotaxis protein CheR [Bacteroidetes bacterium GWB2_32_14]OFX67729.1 MAG: chemotaxis protein CheR [Bacteroidetes bacterium GWD2_33_33]HAN19340.1 chemotaxis protein CheR [Bacteroidales bacterium]